MPERIQIRIGELTLSARLNDSDSAKNLIEMLPLDLTMKRWGDEYYGECGIDEKESDDAREEMEIGEIAIWPPGKALCIFFGPTPASEGEQPRAASAVNPIGRIIGNVDPLKKLGKRIRVIVERG